MNQGRVARRYAQAVFDIALADANLDGWLRDLQTAAAFLAGPGITPLLENPAVRFDEKRDFIDRTLGGLPQVHRNLIYVLVQHNRIGSLPGVLAEFERQLNEHRGVAIAEITTAIPLDEPESRRVVDQLEALVGKKVVVQQRVDPSILGGVVARVGDRLIDGSLASQIRALRDQMAR